jgi:hypothetical protein
MTANGDGETIVKSGTYLYAESVVCDLRIVRRPVRYGTGDHEDPPELANDQEQETYYLEYGGTDARGVFIGGGGAFDTLEEAMRHAEHTAQHVTWA